MVWNVREMESPLNQECFQIYKQYCQNFVGFNGGIKRDDERIKEFFDMHYKRIGVSKSFYFLTRRVLLSAVSQVHIL